VEVIFRGIVKKAQGHPFDQPSGDAQPADVPLG
jgi:hypothetical protein